MHTLLIILIVLLVILVILLGIVAFVALSAFFAVQPILNQLGKISMIIEAAEFIKRRVRRTVLRRQFSRGRNGTRRGRGGSGDQTGVHRKYTDGYHQGVNSANKPKTTDLENPDEQPKS